MTTEEFVIKWNGKYIDFDGVYGAQCMDEMHQYCVECLGITDARVLQAPSAKELWNTFPTVYGHELFDQITNTPDGVPQEGDIILWTNGTYGHVATQIEGNIKSFRSFDQNYPVGSPCHIQNHPNYTGVAGWLRYKSNIPNVTTWSDAFIAVATKLNVSANKDVVLGEIDKLIKYEDTIVQKDNQIKSQTHKILELETKLSTLENSNTQLKLDNDVIQNTVTQQQRLLDTQDSNIIELKGDIKIFKEQMISPDTSGWKLIGLGLTKIFSLERK
jgi:hypothetical protein